MPNWVTAEQIRDAADELYGAEQFADAPSQIFIDQLDGEPATTFLRVSFRRFTARAARLLTELGALLQERHGERLNLVFVIYFNRIDPARMSRHAVALQDR